MAKIKNRRTGEVASVGEDTCMPDLPGITPPPIDVSDEQFAEATRDELVAEVSIPISEELAREFPIHLDVTLPPPSATTLRRIAIALDRRQARTSDGQRVVKPMQALRWLLEQATIKHVEP